MITNTMLAWGDQLGAQMMTYAKLYYVARENEQELILLSGLKEFRRGYQFLDVFKNEAFQLITYK